LTRIDRRCRLKAQRIVTNIRVHWALELRGKGIKEQGEVEDDWYFGSVSGPISNLLPEERQKKRRNEKDRQKKEFQRDRRRTGPRRWGI